MSTIKHISKADILFTINNPAYTVPKVSERTLNQLNQLNIGDEFRREYPQAKLKESHLQILTNLDLNIDSGSEKSDTKNIMMVSFPEIRPDDSNNELNELRESNPELALQLDKIEKLIQTKDFLTSGNVKIIAAQMQNLTKTYPDLKNELKSVETSINNFTNNKLNQNWNDFTNKIIKNRKTDERDSLKRTFNLKDNDILADTLKTDKEVISLIKKTDNGNDAGNKNLVSDYSIVNDLIAEADELASRLSITPKPVLVGMVGLFRKLRMILEKVDDEMAILVNSIIAKSKIDEAHRSKVENIKLEMLKYHLNKLEELVQKQSKKTNKSYLF